MSYATAEDLVIAFGARELAQVATPKRFQPVDDEDLELTIEDIAHATGHADEAALEACLDAINQALAVAGGLIDSYLSVRYTLPLPSTPQAVREKALDLARYELQRDKATEETEKRYKNAMAWLRDLAAGKAKLGSPTIDSGAGSSAIAIVPSAGRTFTNDSLSAFDR